MPELCAALLRTQLRKFPKQAKIREANANYLAEKLNKIEGLQCQKKIDGVEAVGYYLFTVKYDPSKFQNIQKEEFYNYLKQNGIPTVVSYPPLHSLNLFKEIKLRKGIDYSNGNWGGQRSDDKFFPVVTSVYKNCFELPQYLLLGETEQLDYVVNKIIALQRGV